VTHQTSPDPDGRGIVATSPAIAISTPRGDEEAVDAERDSIVPLAPVVHCIRCGRPGRFVRHTTFAHRRPGPRRSRW